MSKTVVIIGAGPAGLTAAYELLSKKSDFQPIILEATDRIGGISCTIDFKGNRIDIGGHRFFSKSDTVMDWWQKIMPLQGAQAKDDLLLSKQKPLALGGPDPEQVDRVLLVRERISRIFYLRKFFDYPISMRARTFLNLGLWRTLFAGIGYVRAQVWKRPQESSLEDFLVNRFGVTLYRMFFEDYTEKVWGVHPREISAEWGAQRIKGLSLLGAVMSAFKKLLPKKADQDIRQKATETSLIEQFTYPKLGPGQLWECVADDIRKMGGTIHMQHKVVNVQVENGCVVSVTAEHQGKQIRIPCDQCFSTMPIKDLMESMVGIPKAPEVQRIAQGLPYRDFQTVGLLLKKLAIKNGTAIRTVGDIVPDTWIYIQERDVKLCRLQIFNNWSPYMVKDLQGTVWIGLEYMCSEGDALWNMEDKAFIDFAIEELVRTGMIHPSDVLDSCRVKIEKAYPAYFGTYAEFDQVRGFLDAIPNLYCIGRNGQHRYNNQDHSMLTAMEAAQCIMTGYTDRQRLWSVNSEGEYHETKK